MKKPLHECKILDPACGSGVFLVAMFNRMAESWLRENKHRRKKTTDRAKHSQHHGILKYREHAGEYR